MATIDIRSVRKSYGPVTVLREVDLAIRSGEFVVLVGPSGCGKSTLLRMIAGLEEVTGGEIAIAGTRVNDVPPRDRNLAMVFQSYALYPHMSVEDNMSYALKLRRTPRERIRDAVAGAADKLGLTALTKRRPKALSGGQRQRVAMGRAIVREPAAFLFDEPLSNLDARLREHMRAEIKKLHAELGATSIYVTHDQIEAMTLADRIVAMEGGEIRQIGTPAELYERPANRFVAGFIGSPAMNFVSGTSRRVSGAALLDLGEGTSLPLPPGTPENRRLVAGIRPEHVLVGTSADEQGALRLPIDLVEPTGLGTIVHARLGAHALKAFVMGPPPGLAGERVAWRLPPERLHLFDEASGERVEPLH
ncbi:ABC transporter ATP-binding protein [Aureimonas jatrophae]|uniref:Carbohydrate ABC transporter ATP-binding protein, CUT1 family n=1 Tax=Aureimonas jatrophae TaxID=1166073 RepID=A0A1H0DAM4_9HYPH|nr:sn-glycerol-3-phosphate ABC transporter ATP-binding protein UgpC [Aureimonas jatrophae]MBB3951788.1 multiple sugar transport system ATP-binding protein [Aureimonas jatrophae]SDN67203.1 carbohydrate ABC transporter ATP-binding protein, CUT1 family [Aureimonas jatrophae]